MKTIAAPALDMNVKGRNGSFTIDAAFRAERGVTALFGVSGAGKKHIAAHDCRNSVSG